MVAEDLGRQRYHQWVSSSCTMGLYLVWLEMICGHEHPSRSEPCHQDRQLQHPNPSRGHDVRAGRSWKHVPDWQVCSQNGSLTLSSSRFSFIQLMWYHDFIFLVAWRAIRQTSLTFEWSYLRLCLGRPLRPCMKWRYSFRTSIISLSLSVTHSLINVDWHSCRPRLVIHPSEIHFSGENWNFEPHFALYVTHSLNPKLWCSWNCKYDAK